MTGAVVPTGDAPPANVSPAPVRDAEWNPKKLDVAFLPSFLQAQFVPAYLKTSPAYLDGSLPGDIGFDPWGLAVLASPTEATDKFARTAKDRNAQMLSMTPEEQQRSLAWMQESELKHGRLAMLAAAGWPVAELWNFDFLHGEAGAGGTAGRAPSLFNGHLFDLPYVVFLLLAFAPLAYFDFTNKGKPNGGDFDFDPMGLAGPQKPAGAFPFEAFMGSKTPIDGVPNAKDMEAMKVAEIKNGRLAMMAITGMAVQETLWGSPVVEQTPFFFGR